MSATVEKRTPAQQARLAELQDENGWPRIYTYTVQGKTIIGQFRRYVTREDSSCIEKALYDFLMGVCGFIAEYGLVPPDGGFRTRWAEPASLIEELRHGALQGWRRREAQRVYADGMTDLEVLDAIEALADEHNERCSQARAQREFDRDISVAIKCLEPHRFTIVPPGWQLTPTDRAQPAGDTGERPGSLADALIGLAASNGLTLIAPPAVEADGQVRLL
ncbi:MAG: hypothetical protein ACRDK7_05700 [Solirubrobacteraceae bacterium]